LAMTLPKTTYIFDAARGQGRWGELDQAMSESPGGIDLNAVEKDLRVRAEGEGMKFNIDPAMLREYQTAPGFVPVIMNIEPLESLPKFLGASEQEKSAAAV
jgi:hypothetical protein